MKSKITIREIALVSLFTALISIGAYIKIPVPVVPFTLQVLFVILAGLLLGAKLGAISVCAYLILGLVGVPIFTQGGGLGYIFVPTFGYLIGFLFAAYIVGKIANKDENPSFVRLLVATHIGLAVVYIFGLIYYYFICNLVINNPIGLWPLMLHCFLLVVPGDIALCVLASVLSKRLIPVIRRRFV